MDLQSAHALYWFSKDTIQVRIAAVFVSLSSRLSAARWVRLLDLPSSRSMCEASREELYDIVNRRVYPARLVCV
jgi:hypothetical protein